MIQIAKEIAHKLNKEYGVVFGENGISHSTTKNKKYYLAETKYNLKALKSLNEEK